MADLLTASTAQAALPGLEPGEVAGLADLCTRVTRAIERHCKRPLAQADRAETHRPGRAREVRLKAPPVASIYRVATDLREVLSVGNSDPSTARATATLTSTALTLARSAPGSPADVVLPLSASETVGDLASAIAAVGQGWSAACDARWAGWLTADLAPWPGPQEARGRRASIRAFTRDLGYHLIDADVGRIELGESRPDHYRLPDRTFATAGGLADVWVSYQGGYAVEAVPGDLVEAAILTIRSVLDARRVSGQIKSVSMGNSSYTAADGAIAIPTTALGFLSPWRLRGL